jgi:hypothetical protein
VTAAAAAAATTTIRLSLLSWFWSVGHNRPMAIMRHFCTRGRTANGTGKEQDWQYCVSCAEYREER